MHFFYESASKSAKIKRQRSTELINYVFEPSQRTNLYQRSVLTVIDVLSLVGGLFTGLAAAGGVFASMIKYKLYHSSLI